MSNVYNLAEGAHVSFGYYPTAASGVTTLDAIDMSRYSHLSAIVCFGAANGTDITVTAYEATDNAATSADLIAFSYYQETTASTDVLGARVLNSTTALTFDNSATSNLFAVIEIDASQLSDGHNWVNLTLSSNSDTTPFSVIYVQSGARYAGPESPTVLS